MKQIIQLWIIYISIFACGNSSKNRNTTELQEQKGNVVGPLQTIKCFSENLKLLKNNTYRDTILYLRNSVSKDSTIMVTCDTAQIDVRLEKILLESKYLPDHKTKGYKSFLLCRRANGKSREISFFIYQVKEPKAWEVRRFLVENHQVKGLNCLPEIVEEFMSTDEYDKRESNIGFD